MGWGGSVLLVFEHNLTKDALLENGLSVATTVTYTKSKNTLCYTNVLKYEFYVVIPVVQNSRG